MPQNSVLGMDIPLGARVLKVVLDFDAKVFSGLTPGKAMKELKNDAVRYDPNALAVLEEVLGIEASYDVKQVNVSDLDDTMILGEDAIFLSGEVKRLLAQGLPLSKTNIMRLRNYHRAVGVKEPIKVIIPI